MTFGHVFFIPMTVMVGVLLGFILGARAARSQLDLERRRDADRAAVRAAREARKVEQAGKAGSAADEAAGADAARRDGAVH